MTILKEIIENKKQEVMLQKKAADFLQIEELIKNSSPVINFYSILEDCRQKKNTAVIAEIKKASPSKGVIKKDFDHNKIAKIYEKAGAAAISVLTDEKFFQGNLKYLKDIKKVSVLPVLRKDFIIDEFQIYQTRSIGADIILLIASALNKSQLKDYLKLSEELGLNVLLETHTEKEFEFALEIGAKIIGINNRDLKTFAVDLQHTANIIKGKNLEGAHIISESGIKTSSDIKFLKSKGVSAILIGEAFMKEDDIEKAFYKLVRE